MRTLLLALVPVLLAAGCKKTTYIELLDGDWAGTANEAGGTTFPTTAEFSWDDKKELFEGTVDFDGYTYIVNGASSEKDVAQMGLYSTQDLGPGDLKDLELNEDGDKLSGKFVINVCPLGEGDDCELSGTLDLEMQ